MSSNGLTSWSMVEGLCDFCGYERLVLKAPRQVVGICEPCARVADWTWRSKSDASLVTSSPHPTKPGAALVLIVRPWRITVDDETIVNPTCPWEVLMVTRKGEPGTYVLPGGKLDPGELPSHAAARELAEETGLLTWPTALETLYTGFSARGRLVEVFLCRGWTGEPKTLEIGVEPAWRPWPPGQHVGAMAGFYPGVEHAFDVRVRLQAEVQSTQELCLKLGHTARLFVDSCLGQGEPTPEQQQLQKGYHYAMTSEERETADFILRDDRESRALARMVARGGREGLLSAPKNVVAEDASGVTGDETGDVEDGFERK